MGKKKELLQISTPLNTGRKFNVHENLKNITLNLKVLEKVANSPICLGTVGFQMFIKQLSYTEAKCSNQVELPKRQKNLLTAIKPLSFKLHSRVSFETVSDSLFQIFS